MKYAVGDTVYFLGCHPVTILKHVDGIYDFIFRDELWAAMEDDLTQECEFKFRTGQPVKFCPWLGTIQGYKWRGPRNKPHYEVSSQGFVFTISEDDLVDA